MRIERRRQIETQLNIFKELTGLHGRSQPKTWGGVELEKFDFTSLKCAHY